MKQDTLVMDKDNFVKIDVLDGQAFLQSIMKLRVHDHDNRLSNLEKEVEIIKRLERSRYESVEEYDYGFPSMDKSRIFGKVVWKKKSVGHSLLTDTAEELLENADINSQVQISARLITEIREMLKTTEKQPGNYKRQLLLLLHEAIKRNYSKGLFTEQQKSCLIRMAKSSVSWVTEEMYDQYDEELYDCDLEVLPAWE